MGRCCCSRQAWSLPFPASLTPTPLFVTPVLCRYWTNESTKKPLATIAVTQGRSGAKDETLQPINAVSFTHFQEENTLLRTLITGLYDQN